MKTPHKTCCHINCRTGWSCCAKPAKVDRDGKSYCEVHDPVRIAQKNLEREAVWQAKWDADKSERQTIKQKALEQKHRSDCYDDLLEALKWYVENDDTNIGQEGNEFWENGLSNAKSAIAKATGEKA